MTDHRTSVILIKQTKKWRNEMSTINVNNRWEELVPEIQLSLVRLINHLASTPSMAHKNIGDIRDLEDTWIRNWQEFLGEDSC